MSTLNYETATVAEIVLAAQAGDRAAIESIYTRFQKPVQSIAYSRLRDWDEAEELSQDVFIQAFRRLDQLKVPAAFPGWLRQIVHRMAINRITRRRAPMALDQEVLEATCFVDASPLEAVLNRETRLQVHAGLAKLGDIDRKTLTAFYLKGQSLVEMSEAFDAPIGTIKRRLHVARKRLAKEVELLQAV
jgi:RNA polymerase sigma-70 factor (ECF subfamily)